jgi:hypothetical protein
MTRRRRRQLYCDAFLVFRKNLYRARAFVRIHGRRKRGAPTLDERELTRGAVVFAIGALDAFLHDLVLEIVPAFGPDSPELSTSMREIAKQDPSLALRVALRPEAAREEFRVALDDWLSAKSFQGPEAVVRTAAYVGVTWSWHNLDQSLGANTASELARFTEMRHQMIHRGRKPNVSRGRAVWCLDLVGAIAVTLNADAVTHYNA